MNAGRHCGATLQNQRQSKCAACTAPLDAAQRAVQAAPGAGRSRPFGPPRPWPAARRLGGDLRRFLMQPGVFELILARADCGWLDGGCWTLAVALCDWLNVPGEPPAAELNEIVGARRPGDPASPQHAVVRIGQWFLDGDGVTARVTLLRRWREQESVLDPQIVRGDASRYTSGPQGEMQLYRDVADRVAGALRRYCPREAALQALGAWPPGRPEAGAPVVAAVRNSRIEALGRPAASGHGLPASPSCGTCTRRG